MNFKSFLPESINNKDLHQIIIGAISPRPIALVSTQSSESEDNLAPYSFFNAISSNPPILMFSISNSPEPRPQKDTLLNLKEKGECVINIVSSEIARQMSLCSVAFSHGVSEFEKSGLSRLESELISPFRVKESPVQFECTLRDILEFGKHPGAANLVLCDVLKIHVSEEVLMKDKPRIDPWQLKAVGRLGRSYYTTVESSSIYEMYQAVKPVCLGFDGLPSSVTKSAVLTGQEIAELASSVNLPDKSEVFQFCEAEKISPSLSVQECHELAKSFLNTKRKQEALCCVMIAEYMA